MGSQIIGTAGGQEIETDICKSPWLKIAFLEREKWGIAGLQVESQVWYQAGSIHVIPHSASAFVQGLFLTLWLYFLHI